MTGPTRAGAGVTATPAGPFIGSYVREFEAEDLVFELGSSLVTAISTSMELQATEFDALGPVLLINSVDRQLFGELVGAGFVESSLLYAGEPRARRTGPPTNRIAGDTLPVHILSAIGTVFPTVVSDELTGGGIMRGPSLIHGYLRPGNSSPKVMSKLRSTLSVGQPAWQ